MFVACWPMRGQGRVWQGKSSVLAVPLSSVDGSYYAYSLAVRRCGRTLSVWLQHSVPA